MLRSWGANVDFKVLDVLEEGLSEFNLLVSNPPYIPQSEAQEWIATW